MTQSKADLLKKFADNQEEDEIFGDVESVDFSGPKQQKQQQHRDHNNEDDNAVDTLKMNQLHINNSPSFQLTPKNALTSSSSPQHTRSSKSSTGRSNHVSRASNGSSNSAKRITRDALSEYSEENDTDITSELSQDEFEGWDECFSKNQSIYQQMNQRLIAKKVAQQKEAEREQRELLEYKQSKGMKDDPNQTLKFRNGVAIDGGAGAAAGHKLTSTNLSMLDHLENDKTINYEFSRDDNDEFEDGFDGDFEESIQKIKQYQQQQPYQSSRNMGSAAKHGLLNKQSMPSLAKNSTNAIKKFKSTMDLTGDTLHEHPSEHQQQQQQAQQQPPATFNFNNRVISKLDRIPSFYNKPRIPDPESRMQLLDKYAERKDQKAKDKTNASIKAGVDARGVPKDTRTGDAQNHHHRHHHPHKKMGHVRYLNNKEGIRANGEPLGTNYVIPKSKSMVFNKAQNRWEGNEVDLLRFEQKPSLITLKEIEPVGKEIVNRDKLDALDDDDDDDDFPGMKRQGNMLYDDVNLKWINLDQDDEYIFDDIPDLIEPLETIRQHHNLQQKQQQQQQQEQGQWEQYSPTRPKLGGTNTIYVLQSPISRRGLSQFTQRTTSSTSSNTPPPQPQPLSTASRSNLIRSQSSSSRVDPVHHWQSQSQQNLQRHVSMSDNNTSIPPVSSKLHDRFVKEEAKISRKINNWFIDDNNDVKLDYYWEIRKLIMED
ncbi:BFA1 [Candida metapsilosis]|uniref:BFA1 n=1 Tax=Candida metapsilosis TaxID=273372 RepID=A0A8H8D8K2_9ASCO|nr:BFA1 [Candida metapsilosis]